MIINFNSIKLHNFLSFGDAEITLKDAGFVLVSGVNNNSSDLARSNGSGKSSIWEGISWALTGETIRGCKQVVNKYTEDGCYVEITFSVDNNEYKVIRYKDYSNIGTNLKIFVNNEDKSGKGIRDTEKLLNQYLPDLTPSLIGSVIILGQGLPQRFTNNTPSGRKEILEKLSKSDFMIEDIKNKLFARKSVLNNDIRNLEDSNLSLTSKKDVSQKSLDKLISNLNELQDPKLIDISSIIKEKDSLEESLASVNNQSLTFSEQINKLNIDKSNIITLQNNEYESIRDKYKELINNLNIQKISLSSEISNLEKEIKKLKSVKDVCPTCGQKLPDVHIVDTKDMETDLQSKQEYFKTVVADYDTKIKEQNEELNKSKQKYQDNLNQIDFNLSNLNKSSRELDSNKISYQNKIRELEKQIEKHNFLLEAYDNKKKELEDSIKETKDAIKTLDDQILYYNIEKDTKNLHLDVVNKMMTIATRDFRGFLLSELINYISVRAKEYSQEIFETDKIDFKLDGNNIYIGYNDKEYENLSGGEKQKVDLIVQFSIRDMLTKYLNFSSNILVLDEVFDNLDSIGCQKVINLISTKLSDIESIFIITHHNQELDIPADREIVVVKNQNGISEII